MSLNNTDKAHLKRILEANKAQNNTRNWPQLTDAEMWEHAELVVRPKEWSNTKALHAATETETGFELVCPTKEARNYRETTPNNKPLSATWCNRCKRYLGKSLK